MFYTFHEPPAKPPSRWLALGIALLALLVMRLTGRKYEHRGRLLPQPEPSTPRRIRGDSSEVDV